ncbi:hypothetical protein BSL78_04815 [Apostichopus japonicus]|uniref:Reverse transcriptase domain-containing protein n=1 Tax=Stichopus japonicus TaxID=307972 RepID=A0A2G8LDG5_STIJA|nr:hypothetical protein BSL78_04815 [Apostichopus japonicus]
MTQLNKSTRQSTSESEVYTVYHNRSNKANNDKPRQSRNYDRSNTQSKRPSSTRHQCSKCGYNHDRSGYCPAEGKSCNNCGKPNHFANMCRTKLNQSKGSKIQHDRRNQQKVHTVDEANSDTGTEGSSNSDFFIDVLESQQCKTADSEWNINLLVEDEKVNFKLDTGSQCNVISSSVLENMENVKLQRSKMHLITYSGHKLQPMGKCVLLCEHKNRYYDLSFQVVKGMKKPLPGLKACTALGLIQRIDSVESSKTPEPQDNYSDVFKGLGCLPGKVTLKVKEGSRPVVHPPRKVPIALREEVKEELKRMVDLDVIEKVTEPSDWVSSMVTVIKPDRKRVRICLDPKDLNEALDRAHYPMKTVEEIITRLPQAKVFSTLDANCGYWQLALDSKSSKLCTFNTPIGRYRYKRLPFGINAAPEIFQRVMTELFDDLSGVEVMMDDIIVWGADEAEHNIRLQNVLQRCQENNLKLNIDKCKFKVSEVKYIGHILTSNGIKPDPKKIEAIQEMQPPTNVTELKRFLGMINYVAKFIRNLSAISEPLRVLLRKETVWHWEEEQEKCFNSLKQLITKTPVLQYFDTNKPVTVSVDASKGGVGAVLLQNEKPVAYASKTFTDAQTRYAQIEKELAAIVFRCEKFHQYIFGRMTYIETDHKPLEAIFRKPLSVAPPRLQRMLLKLQKY